MPEIRLGNSRAVFEVVCRGWKISRNIARAKFQPVVALQLVAVHFRHDEEYRAAAQVDDKKLAVF